MSTNQMTSTEKDILNHTCMVTTGLGIISYAYLIEPRPSEDGKPGKYSTSFLIPKSDTKTLTKIKDAINAAAALGKMEKWNGKVPNPLKHPLRDGDEECDDKGSEYAGHFFINANSVQKPKIVDFQLNRITDPDEIYSGCQCRLSLRFYPFNTNGNKGVACGLNNVQKIKDGERLGGVSSNPEDDFADYDDLDLPFDEPSAPSVKPNIAAQNSDDILAGINFGDSAA